MARDKKMFVPFDPVSPSVEGIIIKCTCKEFFVAIVSIIGS